MTKATQKLEDEATILRKKSMHFENQLMIYDKFENDSLKLARNRNQQVWRNFHVKCM